MKSTLLSLLVLLPFACVDAFPARPARVQSDGPDLGALDTRPGPDHGDAGAPGEDVPVMGATDAPAIETSPELPSVTGPTTCDGPGQCTSGHCVSGICCDSACTGACESCVDGPTKGRCAPVSGKGCRATAGDCDVAEICDGVARECPPDKKRPPGTECSMASGCANEGYTPASTCDDAGLCIAKAAVSCSPGACMGGSCIGPLQLPEASHLQLWVIGDYYAAGRWADRSGKGREVICTSNCPTKVAGPGGHAALSFAGTNQLDDPSPGQWLDIINSNFDEFSAGVTIAVVFRPATPSFDHQRLLDLDSNLSNRARVSFDHGVFTELTFQICEADGNCPGIFADVWQTGAGWLTTVMTQAPPGAPGGNVQVLQGGSDAPVRYVGTSSPQTLALPRTTDRRFNRIGAGSKGGQPHGATFNGEMVELLLFNSALSRSSALSLSRYFAAKYSL